MFYLLPNTLLIAEFVRFWSTHKCVRGRGGGGGEEDICLRACTQAGMHPCASVHAHVHTYMHAIQRTRKRARSYARTHACTHACTHTHTHTHTHTNDACMHTPACARSLSLSNTHTHTRYLVCIAVVVGAVNERAQLITRYQRAQALLITAAHNPLHVRLLKVVCARVWPCVYACLACICILSVSIATPLSLSLFVKRFAWGSLACKLSALERYETCVIE